MWLFLPCVSYLLHIMEFLTRVIKALSLQNNRKFKVLSSSLDPFKGMRKIYDGLICESLERYCN